MTFNPALWKTGNRLYIPTNGPSLGPVPLLFFNSHTGQGPSRNTWTTHDVSQYVPPGTSAVHVTGLLIITHGSSAEVADLMVGFKGYGLPDISGNYKAQCIEAAVGGGQRSTMACWIPLVDGKFEWKWDVQSLGTYPLKSAYALNLAIDAILTEE